MLDFSIGEVESLVLKAYRGAGFSWGMAQEAGQAAASLAMYGLPSVEQFAALLPQIDGKRNSQLVPLMHIAGKWSNPSAMLCPVVAGTAWSDTDQAAIELPLVLENVLQPLLLLPFLSGSEVPVEVAIGDRQYLCGNRMVSELKAAQSGFPGIADVELTRAAGMPEDTLPFTRRAIVDETAADLLNTFVHRTYVPATEASRLAGAGAGLLDND
jgi:hypothetical protein